ncbi:MAG: winged helix-turn-helix transcriptional regulator [Simkania sp.]|nr:winged helix-turn-helix transcriptional regulator [Simkania sp.]
MLMALCGSKTAQKILLFLFVNGKCYGTQLHRLLKTPLTPVQKALFRLEKGGILLSHYEGKTRLYQFNPAFPLLGELELLLKKAYTLLPPQDKKPFSCLKHETLWLGAGKETSLQVLLMFWEKLSHVKQLSFRSKTRSKEDIGWNGTGKGEVTVTKGGETILLFQEKGLWHSEGGHETNFSNLFRWTLDRNTELISLEHLRRGVNHPVFLFYLSPTSHHTLSSVDSHLCEGDSYLGKIFCDPFCLRLSWRVIGPKKNEEIDYYYS